MWHIETSGVVLRSTLHDCIRLSFAGLHSAKPVSKSVLIRNGGTSGHIIRLWSKQIGFSFCFSLWT